MELATLDESLEMAFDDGSCQYEHGMAQVDNYQLTFNSVLQRSWTMSEPTHDLLYRVSFEDRQQHSINVELWLFAESTFSLIFPVWTPGSYMIREYTRNIESVGATAHLERFGPAQATVRLARQGKNRWQGAVERPTQICVSYRLYCREMTVRTNWVERDFASLSGAATFPFVDRVDQPAQIELDLPADWPHVATPLPRIQDDSHKTLFRAETYHEVVDSPIVCGNLQQRQFEVAGGQHYLVNVGGEGLWDLDRAARDTARIVAGHQDFWGCQPYPHYWFINLATGGRGGLEHDNSTLLMCAPHAMRSRESYVDWLGLVSHEFFHTWNIRRLRPRPLMNYDYEREQFLEELWIAEGITSYFDDLALKRLGLCTVEEYLSRLSKTIDTVQSAPGRLVQTLRDSSWDAWTKLYRPDENSRNSRISYYSKGALVSWLLDVELQRATNGEVALDDVVRELGRRHQSSGYSQDDFDQIVVELAGAEVANWLGEQLANAAELDYTPALQWLGLSFEQPTAVDAADGPGAWLGCETKGEQIARVSCVLRGTPAAEAGLNVGDEILGLNGYRVHPDQLENRIREFEPGDEVQLLLARRHKLMSLDVCLGSAPESNWQLTFDPQAQQPAIAMRERWLKGAGDSTYRG